MGGVSSASESALVMLPWNHLFKEEEVEVIGGRFRNTYGMVCSLTTPLFSITAESSLEVGAGGMGEGLDLFVEFDFSMT